MNVLLLVFSILSILTILTYSKLQTFLDYAGVRMAYEEYMQVTERDSINRLEDKRYTNTRRPTDKSDKEKVQEQAEAKLSIKPLLIKEDKRDSSQKALVPVLEQLFPKLIDEIYSDVPFYKEAKEKYPNLAEDIMEDITKNAHEGPCTLKFNHVSDLANIEFDEKELRDIYAKMLKGAEPVVTKNEKGKNVTLDIGYPPLTDFISVSSTPVIRAWLARPALIRLIFRDPDLFLAQRKELHKDVVAERFTKDQVTTMLKERWDASSLNVAPNMVSFTASKTQPPSK